MRVFSRIALTLVLVFSGSTLVASHFQADCPLQLVAQTKPNVSSPSFALSPHGKFHFVNQVFVLRGKFPATNTVNVLGNITATPPRQDFRGQLAGRESAGGVT